MTGNRRMAVKAKVAMGCACSHAPNTLTAFSWTLAEARFVSAQFCPKQIREDELPTVLWHLNLVL